MHGEWTVTPRDYVVEVRRFRDEIGTPDFCAPQDWMCEPAMLKRTGLTVEEHQRRTLANYLDLRSIAPDLPWIPVIQGWRASDYWRHADAYEVMGVSLMSLSRVGVGSVCRRQGTAEAHTILSSLALGGVKLHAFGFKVQGLVRSIGSLASSDSMSWSLAARRRPPILGHEGTHINCANCERFMLMWRIDLLARLGIV